MIVNHSDCDHPGFFQWKHMAALLSHDAIWILSQDWNYLVAGCAEITLELNDDKWPNMTRLRSMWEENRDAMVSWPLAAVMGGENTLLVSS